MATATAISTLTVQNFKTEFVYGFIYTGTPATPSPVMDSDITSAYNRAYNIIVNSELMSRMPEGLFVDAFYCLWADRLVYRLRANGLSSKAFVPVSSMGNKDMTVAYEVADWMKKPAFSPYITTSYGTEFLTAICSYLAGRPMIIYGNMATPY